MFLKNEFQRKSYNIQKLFQRIPPSHLSLPLFQFFNFKLIHVVGSELLLDEIVHKLFVLQLGTLLFFLQWLFATLWVRPSLRFLTTLGCQLNGLVRPWSRHFTHHNDVRSLGLLVLLFLAGIRSTRSHLEPLLPLLCRINRSLFRLDSECILYLSACVLSLLRCKTRFS